MKPPHLRSSLRLSSQVEPKVKESKFTLEMLEHAAITPYGAKALSLRASLHTTSAGVIVARSRISSVNLDLNTARL